MPQYKSADSLKTFCLNSIVSNFNNLWCPDWKIWRNLDDITQFPPLSETIANIPPSLIEELTETMKEKMKLRRHHLHFLIRPNLERINFQASGVSDIYFAQEFICQRCQNLRHLNLSYQRLDPEALLKLVQHIPQIQTLDLQNTSCNNQMLEVMGDHCTELKSLNVRSCPITDYGMIGLCADFMNQSSSKSQKLIKLLVADTEITCRGAAVAITRLPNLREFDFPDMFKAFELIRTEESYSYVAENHITFGIGQLQSINDVMPLEKVEFAINACPNISSVHLENVDITNEGLQAFARLEHLRELHLDEGVKNKITFAEGILPLLKRRGHALKRLQLSKLANVDVVALGKACPILEELGLLCLFSYQPVLGNDAGIFAKLIVLRLQNNFKTCNDVPACVLKQLLMNCRNIRHIDLQGCDCLTGDLIDSIVKQNPLENLSRLYLQQCDLITVESIAEFFMWPNNVLSYLRIWSCASLDELDYCQLMMAVRNENYDFVLDYMSGFL